MSQEKNRDPLVQELLDLMDGPGPDVVAETASLHFAGTFCPHCQTLVAEPAGAVEPKPVAINTANKKK